jgi:hypothetical protein
MENKIKCQYCNKIFSSRQSKSNHIRKFHDKKNDPILLIVKEINLNCTFCTKLFSSKSVLTRHIKDYCKKKIEFDKQKDNQKPMKNEVNQKSIKNNNKVNITINNIQNNLININSIRTPNTDKFKLMDICDIFEKEFNMVLKLIERTYFNDNIEENHSFYVSNLQSTYLNTFEKNANDEENDQILEFNKITKIKKYFFDELFGISLDRIKLLYKTYKNKLFEIPKQMDIQEKIVALEDMRNENNHSYKSYLKLINVLAYDKKDIIINTWTKLKQLELLDKDNDDEIIW